MELTYQCPKCGGNDIYFAKRQRIVGLGGIYGNRGKMVDTPLCKVCSEIANPMATSSEIKEAKAWAKIVAPLVKPFANPIFQNRIFQSAFLLAVLAIAFFWPA